MITTLCCGAIKNINYILVSFMKDIKDYRDKELKYLLIANAILFVICTNYVKQLEPLDFNNDEYSVASEPVSPI